MHKGWFNLSNVDMSLSHIRVLKKMAICSNIKTHLYQINTVEEAEVISSTTSIKL